MHFGDSLIAGDYVTQTVRRLLQKKFGDAGAGFVLAGKGSSWYRRDHVKLQVSGEWRAARFTNPPIDDGAYGLGGVTFSTRGADATVRLTRIPAAASAPTSGTSRSSTGRSRAAARSR